MWEKIIIHHSLTKDGKVVDWQAIRRYHTSWAYRGNIITKDEARDLVKNGKRVKRPWTNIGYHFGIEKINDDYEILVGRQLNQIGAHVRGYNKDTLGICVVGNYDDEQPPVEAIKLLIKLCKAMSSIFNISTNNILGHYELNNDKSCPGKMFSMDSFRNKMRQ